MMVFVELVMIVDILITLSCGYLTKGMLIMQRSLIIKNYIRTWFIVDILSAIPAYSMFYITMRDNVFITADKLITFHS